ncbi:MAG: ATP-binding cassette domain-containing protein [Oligoflexia bacterium]|nr:ATP-binding cassette domain-containing protein [Oligoflexia bacterium]
MKKYFPLKKSFFGKPLTYVKAVDDVSFEVKKGSTLGLVGESGCGKTTLGRAILHLIPPSGGNVLYDDTDISKLNKKELKSVRQKMQIIFQDPYASLNPRMTVGASIMEPMVIHKLYPNRDERIAKAESLMEQVGLNKNMKNRYPHEFSGGQRQRICIARAIAINPQFIVCDESVSSLDVSIQAQILNLLKDLQDKLNLTYIFISHDLAVVKFISDQIAVMSQGKIVEYNDSDEIYRNPQNPYTKRLLDAIPSDF